MKFLSIKHGVSIFSVLLLMAFSPVLMAHPKLQKSVPTADAVLKVAPKNIRIEFNEKLETAFSSISIGGLQGRKIATEKAVVDRREGKVMTLALPALQPGQYQVNWNAVTVDGHRVKSSYKFTIAK